MGQKEHWKKVDHVAFILTLPFGLLTVVHWGFVIPFTASWLIALGYDLWEHKTGR